METMLERLLLKSNKERIGVLLSNVSLFFVTLIKLF